MRDDGYRQDLASQWVAAAVEAQPGERVLDLCAAPGGKATAMAAERRVRRGRRPADAPRRLDREGRSASSSATPVAPPFRTAAFDQVLIDAPCCGLGALRRRADARWRITEADIDELGALQRRLLAAAAPLVRPGGWLVYSVCTLTAAESIDHPTPDGFEVDRRAAAGRRGGRSAHGWRCCRTTTTPTAWC